MVREHSEDTLLFIALTPKIVKLKPILKMLEEFASTKQGIDLSQRFNVILFQEDGPLYLDDFSLDFNNILKILREYEGKIVRANIAGGIFLAATFIIDVYKKVSDKAFRLIILMDKGSFTIPEQYYPVLYELLDKIKDMPFYLDIVRLGEEDDVEFPKLEEFAKRYGGHINSVLSPNRLIDELLSLAKKKTVPFEDQSMTGASKRAISSTNQPFYENLADKPEILVSSETCSICFKKDDKTVVKCKNCEAITHMSCWAIWAKTSTIGIPYVFRCHNCFSLVKLDKEFVEIIQTGKMPAQELVKPKRDLMSYMQTLEAKHTPQVVKASDPLAISDAEEQQMDLQPIPEFEEPAESNHKSDEIRRLEPIPWSPAPRHLESIPRPSESKRMDTSSKPILVRLPKSIPRVESSKQTSKSTEKKRDEGSKVVFCPNCSKIITGNSKNCPQCGFRLI